MGDKNSHRTGDKIMERIVLITGASSGYGLATAKAFVENGDTVIMAARNPERLEAARAEVGGALAISMDVTSPADWDKVKSVITEKYGRLDILVNNAGGGSGAGECNFLLRDPKNIQNMIDTNLTGALFCSQAACRFMAEQGSGTIINLGSIAGIVGRNRDMYHEANKMEQPVEYAAAKGGVIAMTRDLAAFMAPYGVTVNCISPGGFDKGELPQAFIDGYSKRTPMKRMGRMQSDLLGTVVFLASEAASYVTGQNIVVDGGFSTCK
jgi:gluconate 5-dehydrogenase